MRLYDTASRSVRELTQRRPGHLDVYLCGPTVYGPPHLGHGRATLTYDILRRYLRWTGVEVRLVSNITDIEDKIIERAEREGVTEECLLRHGRLSLSGDRRDAAAGRGRVEIDLEVLAQLMGLEVDS